MVGRSTPVGASSAHSVGVRPVRVPVEEEMAAASWDPVPEVSSLHWEVVGRDPVLAVSDVVVAYVRTTLVRRRTCSLLV